MRNKEVSMNVPGRIADRFEIEEYISQGGMGAVYRGLDIHSGQAVAIKRLRAEVVADNPDLIARFEREGEILRALNHPNIVKILATAQAEGQHYLVMEYVGGGSLADLLREQPQLDIRRALDIALDLSDALTRTHRLDVLHRDLKPANVLIAEDGTPRLTDFGVARLGKSDLTGADQMVGTVAYLSPEALNGEPLDERADIWAFGVVLFEMLAGKRPFEGANLAEQIKAILSDPVPDLEALRPDIPVALVDLVYRMLDKDRRQRISSVRLAGAELEAILNGVITPASESAPTALKSQIDERGTLPLTPTLTAEQPLHNLPVQPTPFVGREEELASLAKLLADPGVHMATILGPGGIGKTRLALEAAEKQIGAFAEGVYFVPLAPLTSPELIVPAVAEALHFSFYEGSGPQEQLIDYLREKRLLLVLDNFEHLLAGTALIAAILQNAPGVRILATSRERLNLQAETLVLLEGMDFPDWETPEDAAGYSAVKLFLQSARRIQPDFALTAENVRYIARICRLVQGMPLGIVLAAAWTGALTLPEIADEIERSLDFLESDWRDVPERQRSLRAVFEYSWNLLTEAERDAFTQLSIFRGGFTREAAQQVAGASLKNLIALVNKSLLRRDLAGRYDVHELLRQFAEARLHETPTLETEARNRHSAYYAASLGFLRLEFAWTSQAKKDLAAIEAEFDNIRTMLNWAIVHRRIDDLSQAVSAVFWYYFEDRMPEGYAVFLNIVEALRTDHPEGQQGILYGRALVVCAYFASFLGLQERTQTMRREGLSVLEKIGAHYDRAVATTIAYLADFYPEDLEADFDLLLNSRKLFQEHGDLAHLAGANIGLSRIASLGLHRPEVAVDYAEQARQYAHAVQNRTLEAVAMMQLGFVAITLGDHAKALQLGREAYQLWLEERNFPLPPLMELLTTLNIAQEDFAEAEARHREAIQIARKLGNRRALAVQHHQLAWLLWLWRKDFAGASDLFRQAETVRRQIDDKSGLAHTLTMLGWVMWRNGQSAAAKHQLEEALSLRRQIGDTISTPSIFNCLALIALSEGKSDEAHRYLVQALRLSLHEMPWSQAQFMEESLTVLGQLKFRTGELEQAVELLVCALRFNPVRLFSDSNADLRAMAGETLRELQAQLPPDVFAAAQERGKALDARTFAQHFLKA
jgi:predicted ATPase/tetratricopeptide (TPR) repeat protein/tRNA A-37 threonylcarbamoyl transferase component Bud32